MCAKYPGAGVFAYSKFRNVCFYFLCAPVTLFVVIFEHAQHKEARMVMLYRGLPIKLVLVFPHQLVITMINEKHILSLIGHRLK